MTTTNQTDTDAIPAFQSESCRVFIDNGVATLLLAMPGRVNVINAAFGRDLEAALQFLLGDPDARRSSAQGSAQGGPKDLVGIIVGSAHRDFCAGADLPFVYAERDPAVLYALVQRLHAGFRRLETCGLPVVAALTGSALGGGYELALACHHRIALSDGRIQLGLPEVSLGVIPGGGGTQRLPRLVGIQPALELMLQGRLLRPSAALKKGLVDELADDADDLAQKAVAWIRANADARQPWDQDRFRWPGGAPDSETGRNVFMAASAMLYSKTAGAFTAPQSLLAVVQEGGRLVFQRGL
ncbi:MAG: hypothetical protein GXP62_14175, partial [Oligoflexia bacterium]|nr:hypothetical protein [Oligoflexia bacterium]